MIRCKTCGKLNADHATVCENCKQSLEPIALNNLKDDDKNGSFSFLMIGGIIISLIGIGLAIKTFWDLNYLLGAIIFMTLGFSIIYFYGSVSDLDKQVHALQKEVYRLEQKINDLKEGK